MDAAVFGGVHHSKLAFVQYPEKALVRSAKDS